MHNITLPGVLILSQISKPPFSVLSQDAFSFHFLFFFPIVLADEEDLIKRCDPCDLFQMRRKKEKPKLTEGKKKRKKQLANQSSCIYICVMLGRDSLK